MNRWICLALAGVAPALPADPYTYFGGEVDARAKDPAVEQCEYRVLVEEQRCNSSLNKSQCIRDVHTECQEIHDADAAGDQQGPADANDVVIDR